MPTYEYECVACGNRWELLQNFTSRPVKKCPACRKPKAQRLLSAGGGMLFKGSGFYTTDYRSDSYKKAAAADSSGGSAPAPKKEAKPAAKPKSSDAKK